MFSSFASVLSPSLSCLELQCDDARPWQKSQFGIINQPSNQAIIQETNIVEISRYMYD